MHVWALADLHLSFGVPDKQMDVFGEKWRDHPEKIKTAWESRVSPDDLVLIAGDISWGKHLEEAIPDLEWIQALPGTKVLLRGNHDYWWTSINKVRNILPPSLHVIQNDSYYWNDIAIGGARLWDDRDLHFDGIIDFVKTDCVKQLTENDLDIEQAEKIYLRELQRLESSLRQLNPKAHKKIVMTHYPPVGPRLEPSRASALLEKYKIDTCVFGHIHNIRNIRAGETPFFGSVNGIEYLITAADYLNFTPVKIL